MASFTPAPIPPMVTADSPLHIGGTAAQSSVIAGVVAGSSKFLPIGAALPPIIPTAHAMPLANGLPQGYPFHLVGTPGLFVVEGTDGSYQAQTGFNGPEGSLASPFPFGDASGAELTWSYPYGGDELYLSGDGRLTSGVKNILGNGDVNVPGYASGIYAAVMAHFVPATPIPDDEQIQAFVSVGLAIDGNQIQAGTHSGNTNLVYYSGEPFTSVFGTGTYGQVSTSGPTDVLLQLSCNSAGLYSYSITGMAGGKDVSGTKQIGALSSGDVTITFGGNWTSGDANGNLIIPQCGITSLVIGTVGNKAWSAAA